MTKDTIKVGTFFSGIGAPEKAFKKLKNPVDNLWDEEEYDYLDDDLER